MFLLWGLSSGNSCKNHASSIEDENLNCFDHSLQKLSSVVANFNRSEAVPFSDLHDPLKPDVTFMCDALNTRQVSHTSK